MKLSLQMLDYRKLAVTSITMNVLHAMLQSRWSEIALSRLGPRPGTARLFITLEGLLYMVVFAAGFDRITEKFQQPPSSIELKLDGTGATKFIADKTANDTSIGVRRSRSEIVIWFIAATVSVALLVFVRAIGG